MYVHTTNHLNNSFSMIWREGGRRRGEGGRTEASVVEVGGEKGVIGGNELMLILLFVGCEEDGMMGGWGGGDT